MTSSVLITQCLQHDFVGPIPPHEPLPNALHVGREEATRLLGHDPQSGPLAQLLHWARSQSTDGFDIIHVRDWHDADDPAQNSHLERFGLHCLAGTPGARLVLGEDDVVQRKNETFVDSITLNDFEGGTNLGTLIDDVKSRAGDEPLRVGVVGVWTEAKVSYLLYELLTRCRISELATCSALTASASRTQHFIALEQLRKILGVRIFDSVGEFSNWLVPHGEPIRPPQVPAGMRPALHFADDGGDLSETDLDIVSYLYRDSSRLKLEELSGGFSGAKVFRVGSRDALGHQQAASVLKVGDRDLIASERVAFERVESILGNDAPSIRGFADFGDHAGLKYAYAAMGDGDVQTFKDLYESGASQERVDQVLRGVFEEILGRFYAVAQYERLPLLDYYTFEARFADGVRDCVRALMGEQADEAEVVFHEDYRVMNVADLYAEHLDDVRTAQDEFRYVSYVHGDLNGANILLDARDNTWLIDFFHTKRGHVLNDLAKLENDLLYIFTPVENERDFEQALRITQALRCVKDLRAPLPDTVVGLEDGTFLRAWQTLRTLRAIAGRLCREDRDPLQMSTALLRYAVHTLYFDESSQWQKRWALAAACGHAEDLVDAARNNLRLRVDWIDEEVTRRVGEGRMGMTICPGRKDRGRSIEDDMDALVDAGTARLICLLTEEEMEWAGVTDLDERASSHGFEYRHEPILDQQVPTLQRARSLVTWLKEALAAGEDVVIHCLGGLGRSGTIAACFLVSEGLGPDEAIDAVRDARGPRAIETAAQEDFVRDFPADS